MERKSESIKKDVDRRIDEIAQRIMMELETANPKDLSDESYTEKITQEIDYASAKANCEDEKKTLIEVMLLSTRLHRLYFIVRSSIMGLISVAFTLLFISYFGTIDVYLALFMGIFVFIASLVLTRLVEAQIIKATESTISLLNHHKTIREFITNHL
ncbi:MAG: hypothetical protein QG670_617 [Thermoproteota archaeon]|nr:hypothetical protein [Thermoproteota archaeon]